MAIIAPSSSSSSSWCSTLPGRHQVVACSSPSMHLLKFNSISVFSSPRTPPPSSPVLQLCLSFGSCASYGGSRFASTCGNAIWRRSRSKRRRSCSSGGGCTGSIGSIVKCRDALEALVFDCDGVILESEDLHRLAYNAAFHHFNVCCPQSPEPLVWTSEFYDELQNQIGGGKPKMRWYFNKNGWPTSTISSKPPVGEQDQATVIDTIQDWKTDKYKDIIRSGAVEPRPGVLRLMDEARVLGLKISVCSAATKSSVIFCLTNLLGKERFEALDCFLAGDDVDKKKPDPSIYRRAAEVCASACLVTNEVALKTPLKDNEAQMQSSKHAVGNCTGQGMLRDCIWKGILVVTTSLTHSSQMEGQVVQPAVFAFRGCMWGRHVLHNLLHIFHKQTGFWSC